MPFTVSAAIKVSINGPGFSTVRVRNILIYRIKSQYIGEGCFLFALELAMIEARLHGYDSQWCPKRFDADPTEAACA